MELSGILTENLFVQCHEMQCHDNNAYQVTENGSIKLISFPLVHEVVQKLPVEA